MSPQEQQAEEEKLQRSIVERRNEPKEQRDRRIAEWHRRQEKQREPVYEVPDAFDFRIVGEETVDGRVGVGHRWRAEARIQSRNPLGASILPKMKGRFWISKTDYHWIKLDAETTDTFADGASLIGTSRKVRRHRYRKYARQRRSLAAEVHRAHRLRPNLC